MNPRPPVDCLSYILMVCAQAWPGQRVPWKLVSPLIKREHKQAREWGGVRLIKSLKDHSLMFIFPNNVPLSPEQGGGPAGRRQGKSLNLHRLPHSACCK